MPDPIIHLTRGQCSGSCCVSWQHELQVVRCRSNLDECPSGFN